MLFGGFTNDDDRGIYKPCLSGDLQTMLIGGFTNHVDRGDLQTMLIGGFTTHADRGIYNPC